MMARIKYNEVRKNNNLDRYIKRTTDDRQRCSCGNVIAPSVIDGDKNKCNQCNNKSEQRKLRDA